MGRIEIIIGCMFSGKSTELIRRLRNYRQINKKILSINYIDDIRYGTDKITTHDNICENAICIKNLKPILELEDYKNADIIAINEGQFFTDLYEIVTYIADNTSKIIIIAGLDGDSNRDVFGDILKLIPHADNIIKLSTYCNICNDGTIANYTKRICKSTKKIIIGGNDMFIPTCRNCFNKSHTNLI
jgi:thymidine kinase